MLEVFKDVGTDDAPHARPGFTAMLEFIRSAEKPCMLLVRDYFALTRKAAEVPDVFRLLQHVMKVEIKDLSALDGSALQRRMQYESLIEETLREFHEFLDEMETKSAHFFEKMVELEKRKEALYEQEAIT